MKNYIGICALAIAVLSCKGKVNDAQAEQVEGLYSAVQANSQQAEVRQEGQSQDLNPGSLAPESMLLPMMWCP